MTIADLRSLFLDGERQLNRLVLAVAATMLVVASAAGLYQVFSRFVLQIPAHWSEPLVKVTLIWMVYLGLMSAARSGSMIAVDFLFELTSGRLRLVMRTMITIAMLIVFAVLIYHGWRAVYLVRNQTIAGLGVSASWVYSAIPLGAGFAALAVIAQFLDPPAAKSGAEIP